MKKDTIGDLEIRVSLIADACRYFIVKELSEGKLEGRPLKDTLKSLHGKYGMHRGKPLLLVSMERKGNTCFFLRDVNPQKHVSIHTHASNRRSKRDFEVRDVQPKPKKERWQVFESQPDFDPKDPNRLKTPAHKRDLFPFSTLDFTVLAVTKPGKDDSEISLTVGGLLSNDGGKKGRVVMDLDQQQLFCRDIKELICDSKTFSFARSEWRTAPGPKEFEEILTQLEKP